MNNIGILKVTIISQVSKSVALKTSPFETLEICDRQAYKSWQMKGLKELKDISFFLKKKVASLDGKEK